MLQSRRIPTQFRLYHRAIDDESNDKACQVGNRITQNLYWNDKFIFSSDPEWILYACKCRRALRPATPAANTVRLYWFCDAECKRAGSLERSYCAERLTFAWTLDLCSNLVLLNAKKVFCVVFFFLLSQLSIPQQLIVWHFGFTKSVKCMNFVICVLKNSPRPTWATWASAWAQCVSSKCLNDTSERDERLIFWPILVNLDLWIMMNYDDYSGGQLLFYSPQYQPSRFFMIAKIL